MRIINLTTKGTYAPSVSSNKINKKYYNLLKKEKIQKKEIIRKTQEITEQNIKITKMKEYEKTILKTINTEDISYSIENKKTFLTTNLFENTIRTKFILNIYINYFENIINYICENNNKKIKNYKKNI